MPVMTAAQLKEPWQALGQTIHNAEAGDMSSAYLKQQLAKQQQQQQQQQPCALTSWLSGML
jgi:hypothetical protein